MTHAHIIALGFLAYLATGVVLLFVCIVVGRPGGLFGGDPKDNDAKDLCALLIVGFWVIVLPTSLADCAVGYMFKWGFALRKRIYGPETDSSGSTKE